MSQPAPSAAPSPRVSARRLPAGDGGPALEVLEARPEGEGRGAPILFLHGAFGGAWQWAEILMPHLARRGRHVLAPSLRGHGGSGGAEGLRGARLADYLADAGRVIATLPEPPVLVGHSMGGLLAQMLLARHRPRALALLASLPPEGMAFEGPRIALTDPVIWLEALLSAESRSRAPIAAAVQNLLFSERLPPERIARYAARMSPESPRVLADLHLPGPVFSAFALGVPTLVLGGADDRLVSRGSVLRTALYHGAPCAVLEGMGHFLMLDPGAEGVAHRLLDWLDGLGA